VIEEVMESLESLWENTPLDPCAHELNTPEMLRV